MKVIKILTPYLCEVCDEYFQHKHNENNCSIRLEALREIAQEEIGERDICVREKRGHQQCEEFCKPCLFRLEKEIDNE